MPLHRVRTKGGSGLILAGILLALAACHHAEAIPPGNVAESLVAPTLGDAVFDPKTLAGKPALVMFVSPTCSHCLAEIPRGEEVARSVGANTVAVFVAGNADAAVKVVADTKFKGTVLVDDGTLKKQYDVRAVPYALVLGPDGKARAAYLGEQESSTLKDALLAAK